MSKHAMKSLSVCTFRASMVRFERALMGVALSFVGACASSRVSLDSTPVGADIFVKSIQSGPERLVGKTPMTLSGAELSPDLAGTGPITVEFRKDGYKTYRVLITELGAIDLVVRGTLEAAGGLEDPYVVSKMFDKLLSVQQQIREKSYVTALSTLESIKKEAPQLAAIYELEGGVYMLQGQLGPALDAYRKAITLNPDSVSARLLQKKVEKFLKRRGDVRSPASADLRKE